MKKLLLSLFIFASAHCFAQGNAITLSNGWKLEMEKSVDTIYIEDPVTGTRRVDVIERVASAKLNGQPLPTYYDLKIRSTTMDGKPLSQYVDNAIASLGDRSYRNQVKNIVVDEGGNIVYYEFSAKDNTRRMVISTSNPVIDSTTGATNYTGGQYVTINELSDADRARIQADIKHYEEQIAPQIAQVMKQIHVTPAVVNGKAVAYIAL